MEELKENTRTGIYTPKTKFVEFIGAKGNVNFLSDKATINASQLSGMYFEDITFEVVICKDGSIDLVELDTNLTTEKERIRLLEILEEKTVSSFRGRTVINELMFTSIEKVKDKNIPLYLAIENMKPIEKLTSMFDDTDVTISEDALGNLNDLLSLWVDDDDIIDEVSENTIVDKIDAPVESKVQINTIEDQFAKMKEEKLNELKRKRDKKEEEISKFEFQYVTLQKSLDDAKNDLKLLEDRIFDLQPKLPSNGYLFSISERQNEVVTLDKDTEEIIRKTVSKVKSIKLDNFMNLFKNGEFHIYIGKRVDNKVEKVNDFSVFDDEVGYYLSKMNLVVADDKFIYDGESTWSELVNEFIKKGFEQDSEFDEMCFPKSSESSEI